MKTIIFLFVLLFTAACGFTPQGDAIRSTVKEGGAQVMDESLINTEWWLCQGASIGAIKRRYGGSKAASYNDLCETDGSGIITAPTAPAEAAPGR